MSLIGGLDKEEHEGENESVVGERIHGHRPTCTAWGDAMRFTGHAGAL